MPGLAFSKWSPGGNTTLFFPAAGRTPAEQARLAGLALDPANLGGEQVGFVDLRQKRLRMAGGEFCVNAGRAMGALLAHVAGPRHRPLAHEGPEQTAKAPGGGALRESHEEIQISGWQSPVRLRTRGTAPHWRVEALLRLPHCPVTSAEPEVYLVRLPGICHLLLNSPAHALPDDCHAAAALLRQRHGLNGEAAVGVVWWRQCQGQLEMLPLVHVRDTGSTYLENACGSGALALALCLARTSSRRAFSIMQPGGTALDVRLFSEGGTDMAGIDGPVSLVASGRVWLEGQG